METTEYRGHNITTEYNNGTLDITLDKAAITTNSDLHDTAYWFAYSHLGTAHNHKSNGLTRHADGTATAHFRY
jgi:hypothetical protein